MHSRSSAGSSMSGYIYPIMTTTIWGGQYVANSFVLRSFNSLETTCLRFVVSVPILYLILRLNKLSIYMHKKDLGKFLLVGIIGYWGSMECTTAGVLLSGSSLSSLLISLTPVMISVCATFILKEKLKPIQFLLLLTALIGVAIVVGGGSGKVSPLGVLFCAGAVIFWSISSCYARMLSVDYHPFLITFWGMLISLAFHVPIGAYEFIQTGFPRLDTATLLALIYLTIIGNGIAQMLWNTGLSRLTAATCSMFYPLQTLFSSIFGILLLKEEITKHFVIGGLIISGSIVLNCLLQARSAALAAVPDTEKPEDGR